MSFEGPFGFSNSALLQRQAIRRYSFYGLLFAFDPLNKTNVEGVSLRDPRIEHKELIFGFPPLTPREIHF
jgi:hypothetical protein